jgi:hypothetical protein
MNRVEFIGNSLFIPFFLISVGMVVDYKVFFQGSWPLIIAAVLTSFAIFSKWLAAFFTQLIFKMTGTERQIIFGLSSSHAAATLAIIMVGYNDGNGILDINIVNGTVLLILFTCLTASFVTENAGKKMLIMISEKGEDDSTETKLRNKHMMVSMNELKGNESLLDFAVLVSDPKVINPISVVSVYPNNEDAERMIRKSRKSLEEIVKHFSGYEIKINTIATIDHNLSSGIARVSKELVADIVVLNDSRKTNFLKRIVGDDREHLLDVCDRTIFFCQLERPSVSYQKILVICPKMAELEMSFALWVERILRMARQLNVRIDLFASTATYEKWLKVGEVNRISVETNLTELDELDDFFLVQNRKSDDDMIVFCASRSGGISYVPAVDAFSAKLDKAYPENDFITIYPSQNSLDNIYASYDDFDPTTLSKGVEAIQKIGKEVGNIFKKN